MGDNRFRDGLCCYARSAAEQIFQGSAGEYFTDHKMNGHDQHKGG